jgi:hypothetical protein
VPSGHQLALADLGAGSDRRSRQRPHEPRRRQLRFLEDPRGLELVRQRRLQPADLRRGRPTRARRRVEAKAHAVHLLVFDADAGIALQPCRQLRKEAVAAGAEVGEVGTLVDRFAVRPQQAGSGARGMRSHRVTLEKGDLVAVARQPFGHRAADHAAADDRHPLCH